MRSLLMVSLVALAAGCGGKDENAPKAPGSTAQLTGKVRYQGQPVPAGLVRVMAEEGREEAAVRIQKDGSYTVAAPVGKVRVTVDTSMVKDEYDDPAERKKWYRPIPSRYAAFSDTPVRVVLDAGQTLDLDLTDG